MINISARKIFSSLALLFRLKKGTGTFESVFSPDCLHVTEFLQEKLPGLEKGIRFLKFLSTLESMLDCIWPVFLMGTEVNYCLEEFRNGICCTKGDAERWNDIE